jgi:hypothetical protein
LRRDDADAGLRDGDVLESQVSREHAGAPGGRDCILKACDSRGQRSQRVIDAGRKGLPAGVGVDLVGGVMALSLRSLGGWIAAERFARRCTCPPEGIWEERFAALAKRLRISKPVRLAVSALAQVPAVVGWARPIVLVPAGVFAGLTAEQIEALLAHELAHVCRNDYLVNLFQTIAETLLFYHPAVWWVNRQIRNERENCCDDIAVEICGNRLAYVRALTELEQMRDGTPRLAMASTGGSLLNRVQRLLHMKQTAGSAHSGWIAGIGIVAALLVAGVAAHGLAQGTPPVAPAPPQVQFPPLAGKAEEKKNSAVWLDEIEAEGYRSLSVDQLIEMKEQGVTGEFIHGIRATGLQLSAEDLVRFREQGVTPEFVDAVKQAGFRDVKAEDLIRLREQGADAGWIRQIQSLGYPGVSLEDIIRLRELGVTPEFVRQARNRFKDLNMEQLIRLKELGIFAAP